MPSLSPQIRTTGAPPIPAARAWAARYDGRVGPAIDLTQAVPGYPPHPDLLAHLAEAAGSRAAAGYGPIDGEPALREALAADMAAFYGAPIPAADIAITAGCIKPTARGRPVNASSTGPPSRTTAAGQLRD